MPSNASAFHRRVSRSAACFPALCCAAQVSERRTCLPCLRSQPLPYHLTGVCAHALPSVLAESEVPCAVWHSFGFFILAGNEAGQVEAAGEAADAAGGQTFEIEAVEMAGGLLAERDADGGALRAEDPGDLLQAL